MYFLPRAPLEPPLRRWFWAGAKLDNTCAPFWNKVFMAFIIVVFLVGRETVALPQPKLMFG